MFQHSTVEMFLKPKHDRYRYKHCKKYIFKVIKFVETFQTTEMNGGFYRNTAAYMRCNHTLAAHI